MSVERVLTYTDKRELGEYLRDNLLNKELYKAFLSNRDNYYRWKHSPVETFNEVYYQCTRVYNDPNPESEVYNNYLNDAKDNLGTRYASDMIFAMVNAVFLIMDNPPENVEYFLAELQAHIKTDPYYYQQFVEFAEDFVKAHGKQQLSFPLCPVSPNRIQMDVDSSMWEKYTDDFDEYMIRKCVNRYAKVVDKLKLIDVIEYAYNETIAQEGEMADILPDDLPF